MRLKHVEILRHSFLKIKLWSLHVHSFVQFAIEKDRINYIEYIFPDFEIDHDCHIFDDYNEGLAVPVKVYAQTSALAALTACWHKCVCLDSVTQELLILALAELE